MISDSMKPNFCLLLPAFFLIACHSPKIDEKELNSVNLRSDSISIQLNSPELKSVNKELVADPNNAALYKKRAMVYLNLKQFEEALADSKLAIRLDSSDAANYMSSVDVYFAMNNTRKVKETLLLMEKKFPENNAVFLKLSELYYLVKQYQEAINYVNKALKIDESQARAYHLKGTIYKESGDTTRAISSFQTAIEQDNRFLDAFYDLGVLFGARKNPIAVDYYSNALRINPNHQESRYGLAKFYQDMGKTDEAIREYKKIIEQFKSCDQCTYNLGAIYLELKKDPETALGYFTQTIQLNPNYIEAYFARAYTYTKLGDKAAAKADYNMCLKLQPNYEAAIEGLNNLGK